MNNPCRILRLVLPLMIAAAVWLPAKCLAQAPPPPLTYAITGAVSLSDSDMKTVKEYVAYSMNIFKSASSKPEEIESARARLVQPLTNVNVSPAFRYEYSRLIEPDLQKVMDTPNQSLHTAVNAIIVASMLGTDRGMNFLLANVHKQDQTIWQLRLQAAFGCLTMLKDDTLDPRKVLDAVRRLRDAAKQEDNPIILGRQLEAMAAADHPPVRAADNLPKITDADRQQIRDYLVDAIAANVDRISKMSGPEAEAMLASVNAAVRTLRDQYVKDPAELRSLGQKLAPVLGRIIALAGTNWDVAHSNDRSQRLLASVVGGCEGFLVTIDAGRGASPVSTNLADAWDAKDKTKFEADLAKWQAVLKQPPYSQS